jgi:hypothetical protein
MTCTDTILALFYSHRHRRRGAELQSNRETKFLPDPQSLAVERTAAVRRLTEEERIWDMNSPLEEEQTRPDHRYPSG